MAKEVITILSVANYKELSATTENMEDKLIRGELKAAQDTYIKPLLGTIFYEKILSIVKAKTLNESVNIRYKELLEDYLYDALVAYTTANLIDFNQHKIANTGVAATMPNYTQQITNESTGKLSGKYKNRGDMYRRQAELFLIAKQTEYFPEYLAIGDLSKEPPKIKQYNSPILLQNVMKIRFGNATDYNNEQTNK